MREIRTIITTKQVNTIVEVEKDVEICDKCGKVAEVYQFNKCYLCSSGDYCNSCLNLYRFSFQSYLDCMDYFYVCPRCSILYHDIIETFGKKQSQINDIRTEMDEIEKQFWDLHKLAYNQTKNK